MSEEEVNTVTVHSYSSSRKCSGSIWNRFYVETAFVAAMVLTFLSQGYSTHPGLHVAVSVLLLDIILWRVTGLKLGLRLSWVLLLNCLGLVVIRFTNDLTEMSFSTFVSILACLIVCFRPRQ